MSGREETDKSLRPIWEMWKKTMDRENESVKLKEQNMFGIDFDLGLARVRAHPVLSRTKTVVEPVKSSSSNIPADKFSGIGFASQPNPVSQVNCPPSAAPTAGAYCPFSDASPFYNTYLYDYLLKQGLFEVARLFVTNGADLELAKGAKARISVAANPILNIHKRRQSDGSLDFSSSSPTQAHSNSNGGIDSNSS
ncbi:hypothetical protein PPACK8108_LOCUS24703 [Phakopsora pachyrhizi]|uniref:LisH domain-containing protein n=1 Tax=Phakopsora pachyrhizi TaxID=170000 RepID=A0AAV0BQF4_PHAPC|nr:hypothetical protein PPACK8108_LOCUS24703 [Phakopsora pachyrhizi]